MKRADVGARMESSVEIDGVRLTYDDEGQGPVLLCLHAIGHGARDFEGLRAQFKDRYRVIALDWPGQGNSGADRVSASAARYAELLAGFIEALDLHSVIVLGNSIGGAAGILYTHGHPKNVSGLVLVNTGGLDRFDTLTLIFTGAMAAFFRAGARGARWFPAAFALYYRMILPGRPARKQRDRIVACARESAPALTEAWTSFGKESADLRTHVRELACPVLVAWAKSDRINQFKRNLPAIRSIPNARVETFPGGHAPFLECPEKFMPSLASFLSEVAKQQLAHI